jgi:hypothetical protein
MKPFLAFLALEASSIRLRTSARLRSISACLAFFAYSGGETNIHYFGALLSTRLSENTVGKMAD